MHPLSHRPRRLRENPLLRRIVSETRLSPEQMIYPLFVCDGEGIREPIASMPGQFRLSVDRLVDELEEVRSLRLGGVILFGVAVQERKTAEGRGAWDQQGVVCRALREARRRVPDLLLIADVCLCEYTDHGQCGIVVEDERGRVQVDNDSSLPLLARAALAYALAGAHVVAPSDMMDGRVSAIREALDEEGLVRIPILSYAVKYASAFYGPFREAAGSAPRKGDRRGYQMDPANVREALKEVQLDLEEGADMVMVKPALPCLDVIRRVKDLTDVPVAAYQVSGEYSALCAAFAQGWLDREATVLESLVSIRRAGADLILTYFAKEAAKLLNPT